MLGTGRSICSCVPAAPGAGTPATLAAESKLLGVIGRAGTDLNPASLRGMYLRARMNAAERVPMMGIADARGLFADNGFTVRQILGYSYLPYRRDGRNLWGPGVRRRAEMAMAGSKSLQPAAGSFLMVAVLEPSGPGD